MLVSQFYNLEYKSFKLTAFAAKNTTNSLMNKE
jgi:hypothetical protein